MITPADVSVTALQPGELVVGVDWTSNSNWWGAASLSRPPMRSVYTPTNLNSSAVRAGLLAGNIHVAVGAATLSPTDFDSIRAISTPNAPKASISDPLQTRTLLLNSAPARVLPDQYAPLSRLAVRRAVNKALDKTALVAALSGLEKAADRLFSTDVPYSNVAIGTLPVFNVNDARSMLQDDGWLLPTGSAFRERSGVQLAGELTYVSSDASASAIGERGTQCNSPRV